MHEIPESDIDFARENESEIQVRDYWLIPIPNSIPIDILDPGASISL